MPERLLVVEEAFTTSGRGVTLTPKVTVTDPPRVAFAVELRAPGGASRNARASWIISHVRGPLPPFAMLRLLDLSPDDVPPGTEVWSVDDSAPAEPRTGE